MTIGRIVSDSISSKVGSFTAGVMENQKYYRFLDLDD